MPQAGRAALLLAAGLVLAAPAAAMDEAAWNDGQCPPLLGDAADICRPFAFKHDAGGLVIRGAAERRAGALNHGSGAWDARAAVGQAELRPLLHRIAASRAALIPTPLSRNPCPVVGAE